MDSKELERRLKELCEENLGCHPHEIKLESKFIDDLGADGMDVIELAIACEEEWRIEITNEELEKISTFKDALKFVEEKLK